MAPPPRPPAGKRPVPPAKPATPKPKADTTLPLLKPAPTKAPAPRPKPAPKPAAATPAAPPTRTPPSGRTPRGSPRGAAPGRRTAGARPAPRPAKSLGVRLKVVLSTTAIIVVAGILSFVFVFYNTQRRINAEINLKGAQLVDALRNIPPGYWLEFCRVEGLSNFHDQLVAFIERFAPPNWREKISANPAWAELEQESIKPDLSKYRGFADLAALEARLRKVLDGFHPQDAKWFESFDDQKKRAWAEAVGRFQIPFGRQPILTDFNKDGRNPDVLLMAVTPRGIPEIPYGVASVAAANLATPKGLPSIGDIEVAEGTEAQSGQLARAFKYQLALPQGSLDFYVLLSLTELRAAQVTLLWVVVIPILLSIVLGVGVAFYVGTLITRPLEALMQDMAAVSGGDLEHETVAQSNDEIGRLATTFNAMTQELRTAQQNELAKKAMEHELSIATEIQANLLPKSIPRPAGLDVGAYYRPSKEVGGDYYDFIQIDEDHLGIIVADVSGKGVPGSLVMTKTQTLIRMEAERGGDKSPAETLKHVNRMLSRDIRKGMFVTALYGVLDLKTHEMALCSAGHNPLMVLRAAGGKVEQFNPSGIALGFDKGPLFNRSIKEDKIKLEPGDRLVAYTDGVVEAMNEQSEEYGDERFMAQIQRLAQKPANEFVSSIAQQLDEFKGAAEQHDDITLVTVRRLV